MSLIHVICLSPLSWYPSEQFRVRTVPAETGTCSSAIMLFQVVFILVQSEQKCKIKITILIIVNLNILFGSSSGLNYPQNFVKLSNPRKEWF